MVQAVISRFPDLEDDELDFSDINVLVLNYHYKR